MEITKEKLVQYAKHPGRVVLWLGCRGWLPFVSDEAYIKLQFKEMFSYPLDLTHPRTLNEKLQWLKLHDRKPEYTTMVDKYAAKQWVADRIGEQYIVPTLGVWDHFDDIDFDALPDQFVLKCTHDSGSVVIVRDKAQMDKAVAREKLESGLAKNWFYAAREWAYKDVPPRIIIEKYLVDEAGVESNGHKEGSGSGLTEYKLFCFSGKPRVILVCKGVAHGDGRTNDYCDMDFCRLPFTSLYPNSEGELKAPEQYEEMLWVARELSAGVPQLRVDMYIVNGQVYVGELTFYHNAGMSAFDPPEWDTKLGSWIQLPDKEVS